MKIKMKINIYLFIVLFFVSCLAVPGIEESWPILDKAEIILNGGQQVQLTFNKELEYINYSGNAGFTLISSGSKLVITNIVLTDDSRALILSLSQIIDQNAQVILSYSGTTKIISKEGGELQPFSGISVINNLSQVGQNLIFVKLWGEEQQSHGKFNEPQGIAVLQDGSICIADTLNHRIQKFDSDGNFLLQWGSKGTGPGYFNTPTGLAVSPDGNIFVADRSNQAIQVYDPSGNFIVKWDYSPARPFLDPSVIAFDKTGDFYVVSRNEEKVYKFNNECSNIANIPEPIFFPTDLVSHTNGNVYILDKAFGGIRIFNTNFEDIGIIANNYGVLDLRLALGLTIDKDGRFIALSVKDYKVGCFDISGNLLNSFGSYGAGDGQFINPCAVKTDSDGNIYVVDSQNHNFQKFSSDGTFVFRKGSKFVFKNGVLDRPTGIAMDQSGFLYITDSNNHRVMKFDRDGNFVLSWGSQGSGNSQFNYPAGLTIDNNGYVYVMDNGNNRVQKFDSIGNYVSQWGHANVTAGVADNQAYVYILDTDNHAVYKYNNNGLYIKAWGTEGSASGQFKYPQSITVGPEGYLYIADTQNHRIQKFDSNGTFIREFGNYGTGSGELNTPVAVYVDPAGNIYVTEYNVAQSFSRIQKFDKDGVFLVAWGSYGTVAGKFANVTGLLLDDDGYLFMADKGNNRIQKFRFE